jgi:hypothetical protein
MMTLFFKNGYRVEFININSELCRAETTDGTAVLPIHLLFEPEKINIIEKKLRAIRFKKNMTLDFFKMVVAGCIKICMK